MALIVATGFVVDDAIVVLENIARHREAGMSGIEAAFLGAREVAFTVLSISVSLVAVFLPILLMGGIVGRLFREFAVTLSIAVMISMVVSLTVTPVMCSRLLRPIHDRPPGRFFRASELVFDHALRFYERTLGWALRHMRLVADWCWSRRSDSERVSVRDRAERLFPAAGHGLADRRHPGGPEHLVSTDEAEDDAVHVDHPA